MIDSIVSGLIKGITRIIDDNEKTELEQLAELEKWAATAAENLRNMQASFARGTSEMDKAYLDALARVTGNRIGPAAARVARVSTPEGEPLPIDPGVGAVVDEEDTKP